MPLHVDRTSVHPHAHAGAHGHGHVLGRPERSVATDSGIASTTASAEDAAAVDLVRRPTPPAASDVQSIEQADALVRSLIAQGGAAALRAHGAADPARVAALSS